MNIWKSYMFVSRSAVAVQTVDLPRANLVPRFLGYKFTHELHSIRWVTKELSRGEQTSWVSNVESVM